MTSCREANPLRRRGKHGGFRCFVLAADINGSYDERACDQENVPPIRLAMITTRSARRPSLARPGPPPSIDLPMRFFFCSPTAHKAKSDTPIGCRSTFTGLLLPVHQWATSDAYSRSRLVESGNRTIRFILASRLLGFAHQVWREESAAGRCSGHRHDCAANR